MSPSEAQKNRTNIFFTLGVAWLSWTINQPNNWKQFSPSFVFQKFHHRYLTPLRLSIFVLSTQLLLWYSCRPVNLQSFVHVASTLLKSVNLQFNTVGRRYDDMIVPPCDGPMIIWIDWKSNCSLQDYFAKKPPFFKHFFAKFLSKFFQIIISLYFLNFLQLKRNKI